METGAVEDVTKLLQWEDYLSGPMEPHGSFQDCGQGRCDMKKGLELERGWLSNAKEDQHLQRLTMPEAVSPTTARGRRALLLRRQAWRNKHL